MRWRQFVLVADSISSRYCKTNLGENGEDGLTAHVFTIAGTFGPKTLRMRSRDHSLCWMVGEEDPRDAASSGAAYTVCVSVLHRLYLYKDTKPIPLPNLLPTASCLAPAVQIEGPLSGIFQHKNNALHH
jgi:hypothetical protein